LYQKSRNLIPLFSGNDPVQDIPIQTKIKYPGFNRFLRQNDVALLKLARKANLNQNNIQTICLPVNAEDDIDFVLSKKKTPMTICGFGRLGNGNRDQADVLQRAFVPYVDKNECVKIYKARSSDYQIHKGQFCAGFTNGSKIDTCFGDSG
jgi:secreted trypsin-like serine protease